jgi:hypothetical protein
MYVLQIVVCPFVLFLLAIVLSVLLRYTDSDYPFGIFKLFLHKILLKDVIFMTPPRPFRMKRCMTPTADFSGINKIIVYTCICIQQFIVPSSPQTPILLYFMVFFYLKRH